MRYSDCIRWIVILLQSLGQLLNRFAWSLEVNWISNLWGIRGKRRKRLIDLQPFWFPTRRAVELIFLLVSINTKITIEIIISISHTIQLIGQFHNIVVNWLAKVIHSRWAKGFLTSLNKLCSFGLKDWGKKGWGRSVGLKECWAFIQIAKSGMGWENCLEEWG